MVTNYFFNCLKQGKCNSNYTVALDYNKIVSHRLIYHLVLGKVHLMQTHMHTCMRGVSMYKSDDMG